VNNGAKRPYHIPDEDDEIHPLVVTRGDLEILQNALNLYCIWLREKGTLPIEAQEDYIESGDPDHARVIQRLRELNISPRQLAIELKAGALSHAEFLRDRVAEELKEEDV